MKNRLKNITYITNSKERKRYYKNIKYPNIPLSMSDIYVLTVAGDRLDSLAFQFYDDVDLWWIIAAANIGVIKRDSFFIKPGTKFRIPLGHEEIVARYEELNFKTGRY